MMKVFIAMERMGLKGEEVNKFDEGEILEILLNIGGFQHPFHFAVLPVHVSVNPDSSCIVSFSTHTHLRSLSVT